MTKLIDTTGKRINKRHFRAQERKIIEEYVSHYGDIGLDLRVHTDPSFRDVQRDYDSITLEFRGKYEPLSRGYALWQLHSKAFKRRRDSTAQGIEVVSSDFDTHLCRRVAREEMGGGILNVFDDIDDSPESRSPEELYADLRRMTDQGHLFRLHHSGTPIDIKFIAKSDEDLAHPNKQNNEYELVY